MNKSLSTTNDGHNQSPPNCPLNVVLFSRTLQSFRISHHFSSVFLLPPACAFPFKPQLPSCQRIAGQWQMAQWRRATCRDPFAQPKSNSPNNIQHNDKNHGDGRLTLLLFTALILSLPSLRHETKTSIERFNRRQRIARISAFHDCLGEYKQQP